MKSQNEFTERARPWRLVMLSGLLKACEKQLCQIVSKKEASGSDLACMLRSARGMLDELKAGMAAS